MNIEVNTNAKAYAADSIEINASVKKVFSLIYNLNDWPKWFDGVSEIQMDGTPELGKTFRWKANGYKIKSKIHTLQSDSEIGWTGNMLWIKAIHNWKFERLPNGNTKVFVEECFEGIFSSLMRKTLKYGLRKDLLLLKRESEK